MKLEKYRALIIVLCVLLVLSTTLVNGRRGLEKKYAQMGDLLSASVLDFALDNGLAQLKKSARSCLSRSSVVSLKDYAGLIDAYTDSAVGFSADETAGVDEAIREFGAFRRMVNRFPAVVFADLFNLFG